MGKPRQAIEATWETGQEAVEGGIETGREAAQGLGNMAKEGWDSLFED